MQPDFYTAPPTYERYLKKLQSLKKGYPFLQLSSVGQSLCGRQLYAVSLGAPNPCTLFAGGFHAQEWLTVQLLLRFTEDLAEAWQQGKALAGVRIGADLNQRGLTILPMVNPDGISIALEGAASAGRYADTAARIQAANPALWQANARGVDLNHNFDAGFAQLRAMEQEQGIDQPSPRQYGGLFAHSEPESRAIVSFLRSCRVETLYAFHSQGEEIFWEYGERTPARSRYLAQMLSKASGYRLVENAGLFSHGGCKDYFIERFQRPGFTIEIGKGTNPLPVEDLDGIYAKLQEMLVMAAVI